MLLCIIYSWDTLVNSNDITTDFLPNFKQLIADVREVNYNKKDITLVYCLKGKLDDNSRFGSVLVKISNPLIQTNLIRNTFKFRKNSNY